MLAIVLALASSLAVGVMSVVAPIGATAPVVPVVVGIVLGEIPTLIQGVGIVLAVTGIALTSLGRPSGEAVAGARLASSTFFGLLSALRRHMWYGAASWVANNQIVALILRNEPALK